VLWSLLTLNRVALFRKRHGKVRSAIFWLAVLLGQALRASGGSRTHRAGTAALLGR
jgi:N-acetylglucosaminyl-diphospho-decaprenol L-rhamnosyltransferase